MVVGSISYGTNIADAYRRAGRVLSGPGTISQATGINRRIAESGQCEGKTQG